MFARRTLEAFFIRWPFYSVLLLACVVLGTSSAFEVTKSYTSTGTLFVQTRSFVAEQSGERFDRYVFSQTPAGFRAKELRSLIATDPFMVGVADRLGVELAADQATRDFQLLDLRWPLSVEITSRSLIDLHATTDDPEWSMFVAEAVVDEYIDFHVTSAVADSVAAEGFFDELQQSTAEELLATRADITDLLVSVESLDDLLPAEDLELERLQQEEEEAQTRFQAASDRAEGSRLVRDRAETAVQQQFVVVGPPEVPARRDGTGLAAILRVIAFAFIGLVLTSLGPVVSAARVRTVRFREDIEDGMGLPVIGVIPEFSNGAAGGSVAENHEPASAPEEAMTHLGDNSLELTQGSHSGAR